MSFGLHDPLASMPAVVRRTARTALNKSETITRALGDSAPWPNGRRPNFWTDISVRMMATQLHREMKLDDAREVIAAFYGADRTPSRSALQRYWKLLDKAVRS